ncbi:hypothetical protein GH714_040211 [Hevea brasiliensis]|uniref:EF-hand domain-containing protein n=1 Tax=Hevea brasiliensis TaxID=3981 RepID=A0A6A6KYX4_HEVBR|nr:hypothetical protein GH714_040211 [Hevea brasiliensis]
MSVEVLDGATIVNFVEDEEAFTMSIRERFAHLDIDQDGLLSYTEMLKELQSLRVFETHFGIDVKREPEELARMVLEEDSLLKKAVERESTSARTVAAA